MTVKLESCTWAKTLSWIDTSKLKITKNYDEKEL